MLYHVNSKYVIKVQKKGTKEHDKQNDRSKNRRRRNTTRFIKGNRISPSTNSSLRNRHKHSTNKLYYRFLPTLRSFRRLYPRTAEGLKMATLSNPQNPLAKEGAHRRAHDWKPVNRHGRGTQQDRGYNRLACLGSCSLFATLTNRTSLAQAERL